MKPLLRYARNASASSAASAAPSKKRRKRDRIISMLQAGTSAPRLISFSLIGRLTSAANRPSAIVMAHTVL
jgi:hypothetical protein